MNRTMVRFLNCLVFFVFLHSAVLSQSKHFVYVETRNQQPFYARIKDKVYSSSDKGYLIIPQLAEDNYVVTIGFPKNILPAHKYTANLKDKDLSYRIEIRDSVLWDLVDAFNEGIVEPIEIIKPQTANLQTATDEFTNVLAQVSNTPSVRNISPTEQSDTTVTVPADVVKTKNEPAAPLKNVVAPTETPVSPVSQVMSVLDQTGRSMIYMVNNGKQFDTVVVFIAYEATGQKDQKLSAKSKRKSRKDNEESDSSDSSTTSVVATPVQSQNVAAPDANVSNTKPPQTSVDQAVVVKNDEPEKKTEPCRQQADEKDFISLRRKMVDENEEDKMVDVAEKFFKNRCFSTNQIKNLCFVFLDEDVRVRFLESAFSYVTDKNNFGSLVSVLNKPSNITRFNKLIGL